MALLAGRSVGASNPGGLFRDTFEFARRSRRERFRILDSAGCCNSHAYRRLHPIHSASSETSTTSFWARRVVQRDEFTAGFFDQCLDSGRSIRWFMTSSLHAGMGIRCIRDDHRAYFSSLF